MKTDVLIIGAGLAGLNTACQLAQRRTDLNITILSKAPFVSTNSHLAQGGIAVPSLEKAFFNMHVRDTLDAGAWYADPSVVSQILSKGLDVLEQLAMYDCKFDQSDSGEIDLIKEGGHSVERIIHAKDSTGASLMESIHATIGSFSNITMLENHAAVKLLVDNSDKNASCFGALVVNEESYKTIEIIADQVVLAAGGVGYVYEKTTNSSNSTGDGIVLANDAGAEVNDLEFIQFHPTALDLDQSGQHFLISEALRGAGSILLNRDGKRFMKDYDNRMELAPRDIVSRAIVSEMTVSKDSQIYLSCSEMNEQDVILHFPQIYEQCLKVGIDPLVDPIPVTPVQHYSCGGIQTDISGRTTINQLYACGECTRTGLHGANRLASNSLLEALIFSKQIAMDIAGKSAFNTKIDRLKNPLEKLDFYPADLEEQQALRVLVSELQTVMQEECGIIRTNYGLSYALEKLETLNAKADFYQKESNCTSMELHEFSTMIKVSRLILEASLAQKRNVGVHFNLNNYNNNSKKTEEHVDISI